MHELIKKCPKLYIITLYKNHNIRDQKINKNFVQEHSSGRSSGRALGHGDRIQASRRDEHQTTKESGGKTNIFFSFSFIDL